MALSSLYTRNFELESAPELADLIEELIKPDERIPEDYFSITRGTDRLIMAERSAEISEELPEIFYSVAKIHGGSNIDYAQANLGINWGGDFKLEFKKYFEFFRDSMFPILDFINRHKGGYTAPLPANSGKDFISAGHYLPNTDYTAMRVLIVNPYEAQIEQIFEMFGDIRKCDEVLGISSLDLLNQAVNEETQCDLYLVDLFGGTNGKWKDAIEYIRGVHEDARIAVTSSSTPTELKKAAKEMNVPLVDDVCLPEYIENL